MLEIISSANNFTGAKAGGPYQLAIRTRWAARFAQFRRSSPVPIRRIPVGNSGPEFAVKKSPFVSLSLRC